MSVPTLPLPLPPTVLTSASRHHTHPSKPPPTIELQTTSSAASIDTLAPASPAAPTVQPFIIGVTGASASGKTTVCHKIIDGLGDQRCVLVSVDWFYHGIPPHIRPADYNFDHPSAFDFHALRQTLVQMTARHPVLVPTYNFARHMRDSEQVAQLDVADVIIVEGILTFYDPAIRDMMHLKVFVDEDPDICLSRRIKRDVANRGRSVDCILAQYARFVKPAFEEFILPTKRYADMIMPRGGDNVVLIDMIIKHIALKLRQDDLRKLYPGLVIMADSFQTRGLHTIIRDVRTSRDDIVFYSNRLMRLLVEEGLGLLPFKRKPVITPSAGTYYGVGFVAGLAAISLLPVGVTMESSLRAVCNTVRIGKMVVGDEGQEVTFEKFPDGLSHRYILLLAPVLNTGKACETAIARLIHEDVGCREDRIFVLSLVVSPEAVMRVCTSFPSVRLVVSAVDKGLDDNGAVYPGIGDFATRYFGTE